MDISGAIEMLQFLLANGIPLLFAITVHEAAHGWAASLMGDDTAKRAGRVTLNPLAHIDMMGTVAFPLICLVGMMLAPGSGGMLFGWAKPVPVNPGRMRYPGKSPFWVALAGPASNLAMALGWSALGWLALGGYLGSWAAPGAVMLGVAGAKTNLILMAFNLLPVPPLDGARMVERFLTWKQRQWWSGIERHGMWIVLVLGMTGVLGKIWLNPIMAAFTGMVPA